MSEKKHEVKREGSIMQVTPYKHFYQDKPAHFLKTSSESTGRNRSPFFLNNRPVLPVKTVHPYNHKKSLSYTHPMMSSQVCTTNDYRSKMPRGLSVTQVQNKASSRASETLNQSKSTDGRIEHTGVEESKPCRSVSVSPSENLVIDTEVDHTKKPFEGKEKTVRQKKSSKTAKIEESSATVNQSRLVLDFPNHNWLVERLVNEKKLPCKEIPVSKQIEKAVEQQDEPQISITSVRSMQQTVSQTTPDKMNPDVDIQISKIESVKKTESPEEPKGFPLEEMSSLSREYKLKRGTLIDVNSSNPQTQTKPQQEECRKTPTGSSLIIPPIHKVHNESRLHRNYEFLSVEKVEKTVEPPPMLTKIDHKSNVTPPMTRFTDIKPDKQHAISYFEEKTEAQKSHTLQHGVQPPLSHHAVDERYSVFFHPTAKQVSDIERHKYELQKNIFQHSHPKMEETDRTLFKEPWGMQQNARIDPHKKEYIFHYVKNHDDLHANRTYNDGLHDVNMIRMMPYMRRNDPRFAARNETEPALEYVRRREELNSLKHRHSLEFKESDRLLQEDHLLSHEYRSKRLKLLEIEREALLLNMEEDQMKKQLMRNAHLLAMRSDHLNLLRRPEHPIPHPDLRFLQEHQPRYSGPQTHHRLPFDDTNGDSIEQPTKRCVLCDKPAQFLCSGCRRVWYCNQYCQLRHWRSHCTTCTS